MLNISKDRSTLIKGIVILMMLFLHLFMWNRSEQCINFIYVGDIPLAKFITFACGPVGFFLMLSGYGLAYTNDYGGLGIIKQFKRIFRLYLHFWLILAVFITIGHYMYSEIYPGSCSNLVLNAVGWLYTYNEEMWFLLPYSILSLCSRWIVHIVQRIGIWKSVAITTTLHILTCYIISRYGDQYLYNNMIIYRPFTVLHLLHPFVVGIAFYKTRISLNNILPSWIAFLGIIILVIIMGLCKGSAAFGIVYDPLMLFLICQLSFPRWLSHIFTELGRKSMPMWMIHTWLCIYLFKTYFYNLHYPIIIFFALIIASYLLSIPVLWAIKRLYTKQ